MRLAVEGLCFGYPGGREILSGATFSVAKGDVLCLLGPNGAGKTTLLRCLLGLNKIRSGSIRIDGKKLHETGAREAARKIAYVPQSFNTVFTHRVLDIVVMGRTPYLKPTSVPKAADESTAKEALEMLGISHLAKKTFNEISGGEQRLALISRALAQKSNLLVMDEPAAGIDYGNQVRIMKIVRELAARGYSIVMTSHMPDHAFLCSHVAMMSRGKIIAIGSPNEVVTEKNLGEIYSAEVKVLRVKTPGLEDIRACVPVF